MTGEDCTEDDTSSVDSSIPTKKESPTLNDQRRSVVEGANKRRRDHETSVDSSIPTEIIINVTSSPVSKVPVVRTQLLEHFLWEDRSPLFVEFCQRIKQQPVLVKQLHRLDSSIPTKKECPTSNTKSPPVEGTNKHKRNNETSVDSSIQTEKESPTVNTQSSSVESTNKPKAVMRLDDYTDDETSSPVSQITGSWYT